jgi:hypothetical protein
MRILALYPIGYLRSTQKAGSGYLLQVTLFEVDHSHESYGLPKSLGKALGATRYRSFWQLPGGRDLLGEGTDQD